MPHEPRPSATAVSVRQQLREFAGSLPETYEDTPWGELVMKVHKKVFVFLGGEPGAEDAPALPKMSLKLDEAREAALAVEGAEPTGYGLGRHGWVSVPYSVPGGPPVAVLSDWVEESYRLVAPKRLLNDLDNR